MNVVKKSGRLSSWLYRLWSHLSRHRRRQFLLLLGLMLVSACAEVITLGAIVPFIGILTAPDMVLEHPAISEIASAWGITSSDSLVLPLTIIFIVLALLAALVRIILLWVTTRFVFACGADLSIEVYRRTLYQPYRVHAARNSSEVISSTSKVDGVVYGVLLPSLTIVSSSVLLVATMLVLIAINPFMASTAVVGFGASYLIIAWLTRHRLNRNGRRIADEQTQVVKALQEGLGGIRDVLLDGTQPIYCEIYRRADYALRRAQGNNIFIGSSPRFAMEAVGMVLIASLAYALSRQAGGAAASLPMLGALALGAQRLLPALQQSYSAWASIAGSHAALSDTIGLLDQPMPDVMLQSEFPPLPFNHDIRFEEVRFSYTNDGPWILNSLNLRIPKGARVGLVGSTGSGKSTTFDLLMGLLEPTEGRLLIDGLPISGLHLQSWQRTIAHVPQSIFLADSSLAENIAFGVPYGSIDLKRVQIAARLAQLEDFILKQKKGYDTYVGERGIRLSGGQRQRIGIARALYKQASVLLFDEATSALDNATEQSVMDAIEDLNRDHTILLIAHRLTTVRRCDTIVELEHGRVVAQGTYEQLLECSSSFRSMAKAVANRTF